LRKSGSPRALYETPHSEFVAGFMGEAMLFPAVAGADGLVQLGPLSITPRHALAPGAVKVAVRPRPGASIAASGRTVLRLRASCSRRPTWAVSSNTPSRRCWATFSSYHRI
jgi:ABC-type Fe3+/spermidine/putrescine transport system ATPase subunit